MTTKLLFDRSKYSHSTLSNFQIIAAFLADVFYNHLYLEAIKIKTSGKTKTLTEGYIYSCSVFYKVLNYKSKETYQPKKYEELLTGINQYYHDWTALTTQTLSECIDRIVKELVPTDYYATLDRDQKRIIIRDAMANVLHRTTKIIIEDYMKLIIDFHKEKANVEAIKERIVDILLEYREKTYLKFSGVPQEEPIDKKIIDKIKNEVNVLRTEKKQFMEQIGNLEAQLQERNEQLLKTITNFKKVDQAYKATHDQLEMREQEALVNIGWQREKDQLVMKLSDAQEKIFTLTNEINRLKAENEQLKQKAYVSLPIIPDKLSQPVQIPTQPIQQALTTAQLSTAQLSTAPQTLPATQDSDDEQPRRQRASAVEIAERLKKSSSLKAKEKLIEKPVEKLDNEISEFMENEASYSNEKVEKDNQAEKLEKVDQTNKLEKDEQADKLEKDEQVEKVAKVTKIDKSDKSEKVEGPKSKVPKKGTKKKMSLLEAEENILSYEPSFD